MKDLTPKLDSTGPPQGQLSADEFNDMRNDAQNLASRNRIMQGHGTTHFVSLVSDASVGAGPRS